MQKYSEYSMIRRSYKDYPADWRIIELGDLLERVKRPVEVIANHEYQEIGIRSHGKGLFYKEPVKGSDLGNKSVFWIEVDCLIINIVFAWEQAVGITTTQEKGMIASHRFPMWKSKGNVELNYLLKFFLTPFGKNLLQLASPGGAGRNRTLGQHEFNKILVCIPSNIEEQKKIVQILTIWDKAIDLKEKYIYEKKQQKKWLMQNLLTGKKRLSGFVCDWQEVRLGDIGRFKRGSGFPERYQNNTHDDIPFYKVSDLGKLDNKTWLTTANHYINNTICEAIKARILPANTIVFAKIGAALFLERKRLLRYDSCIDNNMMGFYVDESKSKYMFVYYLLEQKRISQYYNDGPVPSLSIDSIASISVLIPRNSEQTAIAGILSTADREIDLHEKQLGELKKQKKALMQLLLTGMVRVNMEKVN